MLANRTQQIMETDRIHRRTTKESLQAMILMNSLGAGQYSDQGAMQMSGHAKTCLT